MANFASTHHKYLLIRWCFRTTILNVAKVEDEVWEKELRPNSNTQICNLEEAFFRLQCLVILYFPYSCKSGVM
jgi:hypothetical protein